VDRLIQILVNAAALYVAAVIVPGIDFELNADTWWRLLLVAVIFSLVNTFVRPILRILTLPITFLTLGLFLIVINALMLLLTSFVSAELDLGFVVADFFAALLGSIVIALVGLALSLVIGAGRRAL
jgi:putative membrane protein